MKDPAMNSPSSHPAGSRNVKSVNRTLALFNLTFVILWLRALIEFLSTPLSQNLKWSPGNPWCDTNCVSVASMNQWTEWTTSCCVAGSELCNHSVEILVYSSFLLSVQLWIWQLRRCSLFCVDVQWWTLYRRVQYSTHRILTTLCFTIYISIKLKTYLHLIQ